jgi:hypothetical protein
MSYSLHKLTLDLIKLERESWPDVLVQIKGDYYVIRPGAERRTVWGSEYIVIPARRRGEREE